MEESVKGPAYVGENQVDRFGGEVNHVFRYALTGYSAELSKDAVTKLRSDPRVKFIAPEKRVRAASQTVPRGISRTFASSNSALDIDEADDARIDVDVAVIDSGIDLAHPDLNVVARTDCTITAGTCVDNSGTDEAGHGTHVAGTIGAIDNSIGVVGMAPGARLWSVRVLNKSNAGTSAGVVAGLDWVVKRAGTIEVANLSLAGEGQEPAVESAIDNALDSGVVVVVAAGNAAQNVARFWPANDPDAITVSGIADHDGKPGAKASATCYGGGDDESYWLSNWGSGVDITAPGVCILSTVPNNEYAEYSGTSMASPHVAGAAAVLASKFNPGSRSDVETIRQQLVDGGSLDWNDTSEDGAAEPLVYLGQTPLSTPEAATAGIISADGSKASVDASLNARGQRLQYRIEYGPTTSYGTAAPVGNGTFPGGVKYRRVEVNLTNVKPDTTYHYRMAVITDGGTSYGKDRTFRVSRWSEGKALNPPPPSGYDWYNDVSCAPDGFCMAVGQAGPFSAGSMRYSNGQWTFTEIPASTDPFRLEGAGVSCSSAGSCMAVGTAFGSLGQTAFARRWNGTSWIAQSMPLPYPEASQTNPQDISCPTSSYCIAVGAYKTAAGKQSVYSAQWKEGVWTVLSTPTPTESDQDLLADVSCTSPTFCVAVGWRFNATTGHKPVILKWNGSAWSPMASARSSGTLEGVSCTSEAFCLGVSGGPASESMNEEGWGYVQPQTGLRTYLASVSCISSTYCVAGGGTARLRNYSHLQVWDGDGWVSHAAPEDDEVIQRLWSVSCSRLSGCSAVGDALHQVAAEPLLLHREHVSTDPATGVSLTGGAMNGSILDMGAGETYSYYFEYGPTVAYGGKSASKEAKAVMSGDLEVSHELLGLDPETKMHYRLVASATVGGQNQTFYGPDRHFITDAVTPKFISAFGIEGSGNGQFRYPRGIAFSPDGTFWVADGANHRVQKFSAAGDYISQFGEFGTGPGQFNTPVDIAVTNSGDLLVTDALNSRVQKFNSKGEYLKTIGSAGQGSGQFVEASHITIDGSGNLFVSDHVLGRILKFDASGNFKQAIGGPAVGGGGPDLVAPSGVALDQQGDLWVADMRGNRVVEYSTSGQYLSHFGVYGTAPGFLAEPGLIEVDPRGRLWIADRWGRIQKFTQEGDYLTQFGIGQLSDPGGMALTSTGKILVSNSLYINRIEAWQLPVPTPTTLPATNVKNTQAKLNGKLDPLGLPASYRFEYGSTTEYGSSVPISGSQLASFSNGTVEVSDVASSLSSGTDYHYRLTASNIFGTNAGEDMTFKTAPTSGSIFSSMAVTEPFNATSSAISNFSSSEWGPLGWVGGEMSKGENTSSGWKSVTIHPGVNGAFFSPQLSDEGSGLGVLATMAASPSFGGRYFSIWLDMPTPGTAKSGYELRFTYVSGSTYDVSLSKWNNGERTGLASQSGYQFPVGSSIALADEGDSIAAWANIGGGFSEILSAVDGAFSGGASGVEAAGNATRLINFRFGHLLPPAGSTDGALKALPLRDSFGTNETPLSGGGTWSALKWTNGASGNRSGWVSGGWGPYDGYPSINGAFRENETLVDTGSGIAVAATILTLPSNAGHSFSLWANMTNPKFFKLGYELRFAETSPNSFEVTLKRWGNGNTELAKVSGQPLAVGDSIALVAKNGVIQAWVNGGSGYTQILSTTDQNYTAGKFGLEGSGNTTRISGFRGGTLPPP